MSRFKLAFLFLSSVAGLGGIGTAAAADAAAPQQVVRYSPQSLATSGGADELYRRIVSAARRVCPDESIRDMRMASQVESCRREAIARAVQSIHNPQLFAVSGSRSKNG